MTQNIDKFSRNRIIVALCIVGITLLGLASRKYPGYFPAFFGKYLGDALWTAMVYFIWAWCFPFQSFVRIGLIALLISFGVEFSQLIQIPWLNAIRQTTVGHLILGTTFSPLDLLAYCFGTVLAIALDLLVFPATHREVLNRWVNQFRR
jgi:Protein of unknown function (DUF2809)